jgi:tetratricopeptide (TPR) repeat protein
VPSAEWSREELYYIAERAYRLYCEGRLHEAGILFEGLATIDPEDAYCRKALAAISIRLGRQDLAVRHLSLIIARDRFDADALAGRCEALIAMNDLDAARRDLDFLFNLPEGIQNARRLRLQLLHQSDLARGAGVPQLPAGPPDNLYG